MTGRVQFCDSSEAGLMLAHFKLYCFCVRTRSSSRRPCAALHDSLKLCEWLPGCKVTGKCPCTPQCQVHVRFHVHALLSPLQSLGSVCSDGLFWILHTNSWTVCSRCQLHQRIVFLQGSKWRVNSVGFFFFKGILWKKIVKTRKFLLNWSGMRSPCDSCLPI